MMKTSNQLASRAVAILVFDSVVMTIALASLFVKPAHANPGTLLGLTHEYQFDDGSGTTAVDSVGGIHATLQNFGGGNAQWIPGIFGGALNFTNANSYALTNSAISTGAFSVSFWVRLNAHPNSNASVILTPQGDNWIFYDQGHGIGLDSVYGASPPMAGIWENYVVTFDRTSGAAAVYRDGVLSASGMESLPVLNTRWVFGHNQDLGNTNGSLNAALDEVQFYNRILTAGEAASLAARPSQPDLAAHLVVPGQEFGSRPTGQYATASTTLFVDPVATDWLAWNRFPDLRATSNASPGQLFLGTYRPEVDDYFNLKITNPLGQSMTVAMDQNGVLGAPSGQQSVIFGTAAAAPDVVRGDNLGSPSFFNEAGAFNSIFTVAGNYQFDFSFQNIGGPTGYPDVYLLAHTVPESSTMCLVMFATACVGWTRSRRGVVSAWRDRR
jgi:hypothetical protein